ncbi:hypothetical protein Back2_10680 [Nocardioides baekrokdamisoli]|uniref:DUF4334 domain-containing protein n=1 Tax=Nocardioides baekrokdamisoli TaxID=1804624 RepID=A0A3G9IT35_9ACTN|nr:DUF4334 domain-containing protein [Nocardioides baekrokdamisoli]BBH16781.1 hypothetical protein Back2_10680 [Nocardioides baekrokdamisoli]
MNSEKLARLEAGTTLDEALAFYDSLPAVECGDVSGRYIGRELRTGHAMDGLLEATGWYGKEFDDADHVHPLLFRNRRGEIFPVEPRMMPLGMAASVPDAIVDRSQGLIGGLRPLLRARGHRARLRAVEFRGVVTAAMVYDHLPIIDVFRRVDETTLFGVMDLRGSTPYCFILEREPA